MRHTLTDPILQNLSGELRESTAREEGLPRVGMLSHMLEQLGVHVYKGLRRVSTSLARVSYRSVIDAKRTHDGKTAGS